MNGFWLEKYQSRTDVTRQNGAMGNLLPFWPTIDDFSKCTFLNTENWFLNKNTSKYIFYRSFWKIFNFNNKINLTSQKLNKLISMEFNRKILSYGKFNQGAKGKERKNLDEKIPTINSTSFETFDVRKNESIQFLPLIREPSFAARWRPIRLAQSLSLSLSPESIKQFLTPVSFQLTRLEMITSSLTRLDGNFIPVARTWWQLKSLSPTVLKTRSVHALLSSPSFPLFPSFNDGSPPLWQFNNSIPVRE